MSATSLDRIFALMLLNVATMNVNKQGIAKNPAIKRLTKNSVHTVALQEIDVDRFSLPGYIYIYIYTVYIYIYISEWKWFGCTAMVGDLNDHSMSRVALVSRLPLQAIKLPGISQPERYPAGIIEVLVASVIRKISLRVVPMVRPATQPPLAFCLPNSQLL